MRESDVQNDIRKQASALSHWTWRNNNGACKTTDGRQIRYGLGNDSTQINKVFKSSDLIGITRHVVMPEDVGKLIGVFTAIEVKKSGWSYRNTLLEEAQLAFLNTVREAGGLAGFATSNDDYLNIITKSGVWQA